MAAIAIPSVVSPIAIEIAAAATSSATSGSTSWFRASRR